MCVRAACLVYFCAFVLSKLFPLYSASFTSGSTNVEQSLFGVVVVRWSIGWRRPCNSLRHLGRTANHPQTPVHLETIVYFKIPVYGNAKMFHWGWAQRDWLKRVCKYSRWHVPRGPDLTWNGEDWNYSFCAAFRRRVLSCSFFCFGDLFLEIKCCCWAKKWMSSIEKFAHNTNIVGLVTQTVGTDNWEFSVRRSIHHKIEVRRPSPKNGEDGNICICMFHFWPASDPERIYLATSSFTKIMRIFNWSLEGTGHWPISKKKLFSKSSWKRNGQRIDCRVKCLINGTWGSGNTLARNQVICNCC